MVYEAHSLTLSLPFLFPPSKSQTFHQPHGITVTLPMLLSLPEGSLSSVVLSDNLLTPHDPGQVSSILQNCPQQRKVELLILGVPCNNNKSQNSYITYYEFSQCYKYFIYGPLFNPHKKVVSTIIVHIFQVRRLRHRKTYVTCQDHRATELSLGHERGSLKSGFMLFTIILDYITMLCLHLPHLDPDHPVFELLP